MTHIKKNILKVLSQGYLLSLGTYDSGGVWVADVIYTFADDLRIYWRSNMKCRHSKAIKENSHVAGTITVSKKSQEPDLGIQFEGIAEKITSPSLKVIKRYLIKRDKAKPTSRINLLNGESNWYQIKAKKIELIDQENFGYTKQILELL